MRIAFAGTPDFAVPTLAALAGSRHDVALVVTQPDRPAGRSRQPMPPPVKALAIERGLPVLQPESINRPEAVERLRALAPDAILVIAYGKRVTPRVLRLPRLGCFNIHASLLPRHRGANPIAYAILSGDAETGVTLQRMAPAVDAGAILCQRKLAIGHEETTGELSDRLAALAAEMVLPALDEIESARAVERPQDAARATEAPKFDKNRGLIPWDQDAEDVCRLIRAATPWPGTFAWLRRPGRKAERLIILTGRSVAGEAKAPPGAVLRCDHQIIVAAGLGAVELLRVQSPGARPMSARDWLRGHALAAGDVFGKEKP